jgi:hypothetical protein
MTRFQSDFRIYTFFENEWQKPNLRKNVEFLGGNKEIIVGTKNTFIFSQQKKAISSFSTFTIFFDFITE